MDLMIGTERKRELLDNCPLDNSTVQVSNMKI
jgi:hypothetical protein